MMAHLIVTTPKKPMITVSLQSIESTTRQALEAHGADAWIAAEVADAVTKAEAVGNRICGLYYLEPLRVAYQKPRQLRAKMARPRLLYVMHTLVPLWVISLHRLRVPV